MPQTPALVTQTPTNDQFEHNLEALRGCAALIVVIFHPLINSFSLDSTYYPNKIWANLMPGHSSVLVFLVLSGYVIGLSNKAPLQNHTIIPYLKKRLIRIYPIYIISLFFALLINNFNYSFYTILGNIFFLQNLAVPVIWQNIPLWSLNSEILFYITFIPISRFDISIGKIFIIAVALGLFTRLALPIPILNSYCFGFIFWSSGLWLSKSHYFNKEYPSRLFLIGLLFIFLGYEHMNPFASLEILIDKIARVNFIPESGLYFSMFDALELPFIFYMFLCFANKKVKYKLNILYTFIFINFFYLLISIMKYINNFQYLLKYIFSLVFTLIGLIIILRTQHKPTQGFTSSKYLPAFMLKLGSISYGIYAIHFPIIILLSRITILSGSIITYAIRMVFYIALTLLTGYFLELKLQLWIKARLSS